MIKGIRTPNNLYIFEEGQQQCYLSENDEQDKLLCKVGREAPKQAKEKFWRVFKPLEHLAAHL